MVFLKQNVIGCSMAGFVLVTPKCCDNINHNVNVQKPVYLTVGYKKRKE